MPGSLGGKTKQMFTQDQVQEMINHATQQLNESWENRFQSLEESMRGIASSGLSQVNLSLFCPNESPDFHPRVPICSMLRVLQQLQGLGLRMTRHHMR
jgi:hypothetical protein